jgi:hypothetical protein
LASVTRSAPVRRRPPTQAAQTPPTITVIPASVPRRLLGGAIDAVLILVITGFLWSRFAPASVPVQIRIDATTGERTVIDAHAFSLDWLAIISIAVAAAYVISFIALAGRTPGGWAVGIRCIRAATGARPGWSVSAKRWLVMLGIPAALGIVPVIGPWAWLLTIVVALSPLADRSGAMQGWQDRFAGDLVILDRPQAGRTD